MKPKPKPRVVTTVFRGRRRGGGRHSALRTTMTDADDLAAVRKELQAVKSKAVGKIKALQAQVDSLQTQLSERPPVAPPEEPSSDGSEQSGGFVKVESGAQASAAQLRAREDELARRDAELAEREEAVAQREAALARSSAAGAAAWHATLVAGLREAQGNMRQCTLAAEVAGVSG